MSVTFAARIALAVVLAAPFAAFAQEKEKGKKEASPPADLPKNAAVVAMQTEDGVILIATYWKPKKPSKAVGAVVIPNLRGHTQRECYKFASELADAGMAAVTFDFRGTGQSTQIISTAAARKSDSGQIRAEDVLKNAVSIDKMTNDLDAVKQFLLRENNAEKLNIRQYSILAVGDVATTVSLNWVATREFGTKSDYTRQGGDIAAMCLVSPAMQFKSYKTPQRLNDPEERLPIYVISPSNPRSPSYDDSEKLSRLYRLPDLTAKKSDDRKARAGGWNKVGAKKAAKGPASDIGVELFSGPETADLRSGILGFLLERTKSKRETLWEGGRDVDQSFKIISRSDQE